ncbi:MAG: hypothetical protein Fur0046_34780 [Cyanobacteria bacterium J069]|nr:MAG: DUF1232 domain-containing protein [Cyanobacteria bacterium J069]
MKNFFAQPFYGFIRKLVANPKYRWWVVGASLIYLISPLDISPDMIPFLGQIDDALLITLVATELSQVLLQYKSNKEQKSAEAEA